MIIANLSLYLNIVIQRIYTSLSTIEIIIFI